MSIKIKPAGRSCWLVRVSAYKTTGVQRMVGEGTKYPCATMKEARSHWGTRWENELLQKRGDSPEICSLTFGDIRKSYINSHTNLRENHLRLLNSLLAELDGIVIDRIGEGVTAWIRNKELTTIHKSMRIGTCQTCGNEKHFTRGPNTDRAVACKKCGNRNWTSELRMVDTKKARSPETIRGYKRYIATILSHEGKKDLLGRQFKIGKSQPRDITLTVDMYLKLRETVQKDFSWAWPHFDFAMKNPIRPADQFRTLQHPIPQVPEVCLAYKPRKTYSESKRIAMPIVYPEHKEYFLRPPIASQYVFPAEDGSCLYHDDDTCLYDHLLAKVCKKAEIPKLSWYQMRHIATAWCISKGMSGPEIAQVAGWSSTEMVMHYNSNNVQLIYYFRSINRTERESQNCTEFARKLSI